MTAPLLSLYPWEEDKLVDRRGQKKALYKYLAQGEHVYVFGIAGIGKTSFVNVALGGPTGKQKLGSNTLVIFYEVSEDGRLKKKDYSPDDWPSPKDPTPPRAVVVIDEFHKLTWLSTWEGERLLREIRDLRARAKKVQFVFVADLPIRDVVTYREMVLYFRWENVVDSPPKYIRLLPMQKEGEKTVRKLASQIRGDDRRRRGMEGSPSTLVLLESGAKIPFPQGVDVKAFTEEIGIDAKEIEKEVKEGKEVSGAGAHPLWALRLPDELQLERGASASEEEINNILREAWKGGRRERNILRKWAREVLERGLLRETRYSPGLAPLPNVVFSEETGLLEFARKIVGFSVVGALAPSIQDLYTEFILLRNIGQRIYGIFFLLIEQKHKNRWLLWILQVLLMGAFILLLVVDPLGSASWLKWNPSTWLSPSTFPLFRWLYLLAGYFSLGWGYYSIFRFFPCLTFGERFLRFSISVFVGWLLFALLLLFLLIPFVQDGAQSIPTNFINIIILITPIAVPLWVFLLVSLNFFYKWLRDSVRLRSFLKGNPIEKLFTSSDSLTFLAALSWSGMWMILPVARLFPPGGEAERLSQVRLLVLSLWTLAFSVSLSTSGFVYHPSNVSPFPNTIEGIGVRYIITALVFICGIFLQKNGLHLQGLDNLEAGFITLLFGIAALTGGFIQNRTMFIGHTAAIPEVK